VSLDITWLRDESLEDVDNLPPPDIIAQEIIEDLEAGLTEFSAIAESLAPNARADGTMADTGRAPGEGLLPTRTRAPS
jgi:type I restriction enzyme M protein